MKPRITFKARQTRFSKRQTKKTVQQTKKLRRRKRRSTGRGYRTADKANQQLSRFRQASVVAVAITMLLLTVFSDGEAEQTQDTAATETVQETTQESVETTEEDTVAIENIGQAATDEAVTTIRELWTGFYQNLPKLLIALAALLLAWLLSKLIRPLLRRATRNWRTSSAVMAVTSISIWLLAIGVALSVLAGDIRALVGSVGLVGLALSWALQTPIESFTGWLLNSFKGYYRVGDRIAVGDVFGDVYQIDSLNTTVWEIGSPEQMGAVQAEQPTGRLVTFPNNEILTSTVINLTRDFPYVWDELAVPIANESNLMLALEVLQKVADDLLGAYMEQPAQKYERILKKANINEQVAQKPQLFVSATDSWTNITIRYLVGAKSRRKWKSELQIAVSQELNQSKYRRKIISAYTRQQYQPIDSDGVPVSGGSTGQNLE
jgi:small-conductance mechanosensitive channel